MESRLNKRRRGGFSGKINMRPLDEVVELRSTEKDILFYIYRESFSLYMTYV